MRKWSIFALKYLPAVGVFTMCVHCLLLLLGYEVKISELVTGQYVTSTIILLLASYAFQFCSLHRMMIGYTFVVSLCIYTQRTIGFGEILLWLRIAIFAIGVLLLGAMVKRILNNTY